MALLDAVDCPAIRAAIDAALDTDALPDATIELDQFMGEGMREVLRRAPDAETATGDTAAQLKTAAILFAASLLAPVAPLYSAENVASTTYSYQRAARDPQALAASLRARALGMIRSATGATSPAGLSGTFAIARAGR